MPAGLTRSLRVQPIGAYWIMTLCAQLTVLSPVGPALILLLLCSAILTMPQGPGLRYCLGPRRYAMCGTDSADAATSAGRWA
eukprot:1513839-Rhodomonas_salina.1